MEIMDNVMSFLADDALIVIPMLWFVGSVLKSTPAVGDWLIPWILIVVGVCATIALLGVSPGSVVQGVLVASAAVMGHQLLKQTVNKL